jgi:Flp pilus assembly protein TadD
MWEKRASEQIDEGHYTAAAMIYRQAMEDAPNNATPALRLAKLYADWNRPDQGLAVLSEAVDRGAVNTLTTPLRFELLTQAQLWDQLQLEAQTEISQNPSNESAWRALTLAFLHQGDCAAATQSAIHWVSTGLSQTSEAAYYLAVLSVDPKRLTRDAPELLQTNTSCEADLTECMGYNLIRQERWALAICALRPVVHQYPQNAYVRGWLGEALSRNDLNAEAERHLLEAVRLTPEAPLPWLLLGKHYLNIGELEAARNPLLNAQALDPANPAPCLAIAEIKARTSAYEEIKIWADAALDRAPNDAEIWKAVARLYLARNLNQEGYPRLAAEGAVRLEPDDGEAHMLLGRTHLQSGRTQEAIEALEQSIELIPHSGEAHFWLGQALKASGALQQAQREITQAADLGYISGH